MPALRPGRRAGQALLRQGGPYRRHPLGIAVGSDLRFPGIEGARTARVRLVNAYLARFHVAAATDPVLGGAFVRVVNLMDRPEGLLSPTIALRVLRGNLQRAATRPRRPRPTSRTKQKEAA